jgi:hypothetical protein
MRRGCFRERNVRIAAKVAAVSIAIALCVGTAAFLASAQAPNRSAVSEDDYRVYNAVLDLMQFPKNDVHVVISDATLNFKCGGESGNPTLANGCSFLAIPPDTADQIRELLRKKWPDLAKSTWADFQEKNNEGAKLTDSFVTPWKHRLVGADIHDDGAKEWDSPDMELFLSRVGFNVQKSEAVVYVLSFSYMDQVPTGGDYFLFRLNEQKKWQPNGRIRYFDQEQSESK